MSEEEDAFDPLDWPEEFLAPGGFGEGETISSILVERGLREIDLLPLAEHLRNGFPLSTQISGMIADAIECRPGALCRISVRRLQEGRPSGRARTNSREHDPLTHTQKIEIGRSAEDKLFKLKRGEGQTVIHGLCNEYRVSKSTINNCRRYFKAWCDRLSTPPVAGNTPNYGG